MSLLDVSNLEVSFPGEDGRVTAVRGVTYSVNKGEVLAIVGESGSGKSVSSLAVMGLLPDQARVTGSIKLDGTELLGRSDKELSKLRGKTVSMVFQDPLTALTPVYTIGDQIAEALLVHGDYTNKRAAHDRAVELLELVGIPDPAVRAKGFPHEFSGGMRQRVVIAIAIANNPDLIICDEPTTALDVTVQAQILDLLRKARDVTGAGIVMITHDLGVVAGFADRALVMYAGRAVETATVPALFADPRMPYTVGLLGSIPRLDAPAGSRLVPIPGVPPSLSEIGAGCSFAPRCPLVVDECRSSEPALTEVAADHEAACIRTADVTGRSAAEIYHVAHEETHARSVAVDASTTVLAVSELRKTFALTKGVVFRRKIGEIRAVDGISFDIHKGETFGLVGESGCGKSTTITQILELAVPESGSIELFGRGVDGLSKADRRDIRRRLQVVFQDPVASLDPRLPIFDVLAEPLRLDGWNKDRVGTRVYELLQLVGMREEHAVRYPADFSGGQKQRIGIARALALEPELLVLDEPVSALDVSIQAGVINLLQDLQRDLGLSYLFVSHDLSVVKHLAHRVAVMFEGKIVETGHTEALFADPQHEYTRKLLSAIPVPDPTANRPHSVDTGRGA